jgi:molybdopterin molybdotransferase
MISLEDAKARIFAGIPACGSEEIPLAHARGRIAAREIRAEVDLPRFDNSAMDGYAVRAADVAEATQSKPAFLKLAGRIGAGECFQDEVRPGECVRLFTGSPLPRGADAVVMQEDTIPAHDGIHVLEAAKPFENVRLRGEDVRHGTILLRPGDKLRSLECALLAASGVNTVPVFSRVPVALMATGNELREPGEALEAGQIYESNRTLISGLLAEMDCPSCIQPLVQDDLDTTCRALEEAFAAAPVVITTGGVSVGEFDYVKDALARLGGSIDLWKIAMRPGKPFVYGRFEDKFLFGLPGNPVSALVTFLLIVRPAILKMQGAARTELPVVEGELAESLVNRGDRRHFFRVRFEQNRVHPGGPQASHRIGNFNFINGLVDVPAGATFPAGTRIPATGRDWA